MKKTGIILIILVVVALLLEGYAVMYPDDDWALITDVVRTVNEELGGMIGFLLGFLCGHFFWCNCDKD